MFKEKLLNWLNLFLIANVFFTILSAIWLAIAVLGQASGVNLGLDLWYSLWQPVFSPAISILIGGAVVSGVGGWLIKKLPNKAS